ncbi:probable disease resistance protein RXW24L [Salvia hispanica]|uniref:probable disease resistance protein RXW24L n=1 Tax=Salvia hispanica TaxID=49212 RepID=UPI0020092D09|nr:probable disease resistance protein RXW24L [Salvia hispanica]
MGFKESMVNFKMSQYLRIFVVEGCKFEGGKLPSKVGELIHLRYLSLRYSNVRELPKSICSLPYLQTLDLRVSVDIKLPNVIWKMKRLKHLFLNTEIEVIGGEKLKLGGLQELETLDEISSETTCIADIPTLISLQKMRVEVRDVDVDNMSIVLKNKNSQLRESYLSVDSCDFSSENGREVLNHWLMSPSLVSLVMQKCIMSSSVPYYKPEMCQNLEMLHLIKCKGKVDVKDFGKYPMLQQLYLDEVEMEETLTCYSDSFPRLRNLSLCEFARFKGMGSRRRSNAKTYFLGYSGMPQFGEASRWFEIHLHSSSHVYLEYAKRIHGESK